MLLSPRCFFFPPFQPGQHITTLPIPRTPSARTQLYPKAVSCFGFPSPPPLPRLPSQDKHQCHSLPKPEHHHHLSFKNTHIAHRAPDLVCFHLSPLRTSGNHSRRHFSSRRGHPSTQCPPTHHPQPFPSLPLPLPRLMVLT